MFQAKGAASLFLILSLFGAPAGLANEGTAEETTVRHEFGERMPDFNRDVIYQIVTDRFFNGRTDNDDPPQSKGMFDPEHKNWHAYWGGDLAGITRKLSYIKSLGATAIWISPAVDNINKPVFDDTGLMNAPYHGYHPRDFKKVEEHFGDAQNSWIDFDNLTNAAHKMGMKVFVDMPANHTSQYNHGEWGVLYDNGFFKCEFNYDKMKFFHHLPQVVDYNDRYQVQYYTIFYLADLDQEHPFVDRYLKASAREFQIHGADGTRLDAAKHITWGWEHSFANSLYKYGPHLVMGEWWMNDTNEPLYRDAVKFSNKGGITLFDFPFAFAVRKAFQSGKGGGGSLVDLAKTIDKENSDFDYPNELITFIDNHDMPRFLSINNNERSLQQALALLFTCRGIPSLIYGTEQNLHDDTRGGEDPYDRPYMTNFDEEAPTFKLIQALSAVRSANIAFAYGRTKTLHVDQDCYVFERRFGTNVAVVAINKSEGNEVKVNALATSLSEGVYSDALDCRLNGGGISADASGNIATVTLAPGSVSIWSETGDGIEPCIGSIGPRLPGGGATVTICGTGFGAARGKVMVGKESIDIFSWSGSAIKVSTPYLTHGKQPVRVVTAAGARSNEVMLNIAEAPLIPIRFIVKNPPLQQGEQLFVTGDVLCLGEGKKTWMDAAGPMVLSEDGSYILSVPLPAGKKVKCKLLIMDKEGKLSREESGMQTYKVPTLGSWRRELVWHD
jgi:glycosidase